MWITMRRVHADGWIHLPPPVRPAAPPPKPPTFTAVSNPQPLLAGVRGDLGPPDTAAWPARN